MWSPSSWRSCPISQQPVYPDPARAAEILRSIEELPPLVVSGEIENLKTQLRQAAIGNAFVLHGGDCAERFRDVGGGPIVRKLKILLQMSLVLSHGIRKPVIRIGRIAGQYAKPRTADTETVAGREIATYRGDLINDLEATPEARSPDPQRLERGYYHAAATLNFVRALVDGGFADLRHPEHWQLDWMGAAPRRATFQEIADRIHDAIDFFESLGGVKIGFLERAEIFTSHEGLVLGYEEALTRLPPRRPRHCNLGAHFLWIGERTRALDGAHVEYFRGLANPIGVKIGPSCTPDELLRLIERLNPDDEPGRLTVILRLGQNHVGRAMPALVRAVKTAGRQVLWSCDPMHGNGTVIAGGVKTRNFDAILQELRTAFEIHRAEGTRLGGVHFELSGDDVTECIGGAQGIAESDLSRHYETGCDPRLNYAQSMELAFLIAELHGR